MQSNVLIISGYKELLIFCMHRTLNKIELQTIKQSHDKNGVAMSYTYLVLRHKCCLLNRKVIINNKEKNILGEDLYFYISVIMC